MVRTPDGEVVLTAILDVNAVTEEIARERAATMLAVRLRDADEVITQLARRGRRMVGRYKF